MTWQTIKKQNKSQKTASFPTPHPNPPNPSKTKAYLLDLYVYIKKLHEGD